MEDDRKHPGAGQYNAEVRRALNARAKVWNASPVCHEGCFRVPATRNVICNTAVTAPAPFQGPPVAGRIKDNIVLWPEPLEWVSRSLLPPTPPRWGRQAPCHPLPHPSRQTSLANSVLVGARAAAKAHRRRRAGRHAGWALANDEG